MPTRTTTTEGNALSVPVSDRKKHGGWKAMPLILGNETFERFASTGLLSNFMVYLLKEYNMNQVSAANLLFIWSGVTNFAPLVGGFISDAYVGKFLTILVASFASFLGMLAITLTAWIPDLLPPKCQPEQRLHDHCIGPSTAEMGVLLTGLGLLTIGTGGIRPCSIPFGVDQFDPTTEEGAKGISSFFSWYYTTFTIVILLTLTLVVYIQDQVSWVIGFAIPTILMACSIVLFLVGTRIYVRTKPQGSVFSSFVQVFVAAYKKRHLNLPAEGPECGVYYDPPSKENVESKLPLTYQFRFLNKAAIMTENDIELNGSFNRWRLSSVQDVEEASRPQVHNPRRFHGVISMIVIGIYVPVYDRIIAPALQKITKREGGITLLQRIGIGHFFTILTLIACGVFEQKRRNWATSHPGAPPISVFWLSPQLALMGFCESFNVLGQIEFYNRQFPDNMRCIANSLIFCSLAGSSYLCSMVVNIVHHVTGGHGHPDWLTNDLNAGRLDYFYYIIAVMAFFNFVYFVYVAHQYRENSVTTCAKPQGSVFSSIVQVFVAAYKKRHLNLPADGPECGVYYDPPSKENVESKLPLTYQFRFLNKAAIITENDIKLNGSFNRWRLSSVQDVEEVKCIIRNIHVWSSGIIGFTTMGQQWTFTLPRALIMDRHLGPKFIIPTGSMGVISMIVIRIYVPVYDRIIDPALQKITKREGGITLLQRIRISHFFTILTLIACGVFEQKRRNWATSHPGAPLISVFWLSPQLALMGFCESFNILEKFKFYNRQFPDNMRSIANSLIFCSLAGSSYLCSIVGKYTIFWSFELEIDPIVVEENMWNQLLVRKCADVHDVGNINVRTDQLKEADTPSASSFQLIEAPFSSTSALLAQLKLNNPEVAETHPVQERVSYEHVDSKRGVLHLSMRMHNMCGSLGMLWACGRDLGTSQACGWLNQPLSLHLFPPKSILAGHPVLRGYWSQRRFLKDLVNWFNNAAYED
ncbi:hypothetical protein GQ457_06G005320 [Hibiscus cannabinus]